MNINEPHIKIARSWVSFNFPSSLSPFVCFVCRSLIGFSLVVKSRKAGEKQIGRREERSRSRESQVQCAWPREMMEYIYIYTILYVYICVMFININIYIYINYGYINHLYINYV